MLFKRTTYCRKVQLIRVLVLLAVIGLFPLVLFISKPLPLPEHQSDSSSHQIRFNSSGISSSAQLSSTVQYHFHHASKTDNFSLRNPQHPLNYYNVHGKILTPSWYIYASVPSDNHLSFNRFGIYPTILPPSTSSLSPPDDHFLVVLSSHILLDQPTFHTWFEKTLNSLEPDGSACHSIKVNDNKAWVMVSLRPLTRQDFPSKSDHSPFASCYWTHPKRNPNTQDLEGSPFGHVNDCVSVLKQSRIDSAFNPVKVLTEQHLKNLSPQYKEERTAYVFGFMSKKDNSKCSLQSMDKKEVFSMIYAVKQVRKFSERRIILLVEDDCEQDFINNFDGIQDLEIIPFKVDFKMEITRYFEHDFFRASFYIKSYFMMKVNDYIPNNPIDRIISVDWDLFLLDSFDELFDLPIPSISLLGTNSVGGSTVPMNGGLLVFSPGNNEFMEFWKSLFKPWQGWSYFTNNNNIRHSEQETFLYWFRLNDAFYYLPPVYNMGLKYIAQTRQFGGDINDYKFKCVHFYGGKKPHKLLNGGGVFNQILVDHFPDFVEMVSNGV
ncbi:hypothetical protein P9112_001589 [Eukaryota sp. TZLM1-RC]